MTEFRQFKLVNGDEIIADVVQWNEEDTIEILIRKAMKLVYVDDYENGSRYYHFRPWMLLQESSEEIMVLNADHILAEGTPSIRLIEYYYGVLKEYDTFLGNTIPDEDDKVSYDTVEDFVDSHESLNLDKKMVH
jgi:hypothetical protein